MKQEKKPVDIVITTWNRPKFTERMILAIKHNTRYPHRIIVVDNGSMMITRNMLFKFQKLGLIDDLVLLKENRGLEPAKNIGLKLVRSERFVSTDNDCLPMKNMRDGDWLGKLNDLMDRNPEYAAISCRTQVMIGTGNIFDGHEDEELLEFPHPGGSLRLMDTGMVQAVGGWRDDVDSRGQEEKYISGQLRDRFDLKTGFAVKVKTFHMFGDGKRDWGYTGMDDPTSHGHSDIWHPALTNPDDENEIKEICGDV